MDSALPALPRGKGVSRGRLDSQTPGREHPRLPRKLWTNAAKQKRTPVSFLLAMGMDETKLLPLPFHAYLTCDDRAEMYFPSAFVDF